MRQNRSESAKALRSVVTMAAAVAGVFAAESLQGSTYTWSGTSTYTWSTPGNWDLNNGLVPGVGDEAKFTNVLTSGKTIVLGASRTIDTLSFDATNSFTIGAATDTSSSYLLTLTSVNRSSTSSGTQTLVRPTTLAGNSVWDIGGSGGYLLASGVIGDGAAGYSLTKNGGGELRFGVVNTYTGATTVNDGTLRLMVAGNNTIKGDLTVGDGTHTAAVVVDAAANGQVITNAVTITINRNGTLSLNAKGSYQETVNVVGGTLDLGGGTLNVYQVAATPKGPSFTMTGGTVQNGTLNTGIAYPLSSNAASTTALISASLAIGGGPNTITVANGEAAIDMEIAGNIAGTDMLYKAGAGVLMLSNPTGNTYSNAGRSTQVNAGTLLVNNTSGSGTSNRPVLVNAGGTLGGTGFIGGLSGVTATTVTLTGTSASALAVLAPGSINTTSGDALVGTLTVGSSVQSNSVTFANYSALQAQLGSAAASDRLAIYGDLNLNSALNQDSLTLSTVSGATLGGTYTLATFTGTLKGRFDSVTLDAGALGESYVLQYRDLGGAPVAGTADITGGGSIVLVVPEPGSALLVAAGGALAMVRRRRAQ